MKTKQQLADEIKALQAEYDAMPDAGINYKPKYGEDYFYINEYGCVLLSICGDSKYDLLRLAIGNCYPTREAAERIVRNLKTLIKLREFAFEPDWNDWEQEKYCFNLDQEGNLDYYMTWAISYGSPVHFATYEIRAQALKAVGKNAVTDMLVGGLV